MESFNNFIAESFNSKPYKYTIQEHFPTDAEEERTFDEIDWRNLTTSLRNSDPEKYQVVQAMIEFKFKSESGTHFTVLYSSLKGDLKNWNLVFTNDRKDGGTYAKNKDIMGGFETKEVIRIFNTVISTMYDVLYGYMYKGEERDWQLLYREGRIKFEAAADEPSRVRLYKRLMNKFKDDIKERYKISIGEKKNEKGYVEFEIISKSKKERLSDSKERKRKLQIIKDRRKKEREEKQKKEESKKINFEDYT